MINKISLHAFRNLKDQTVRFDKSLSLIVGENGSGKTSFLEALYTLSNGKSFRSHRTKTIIQLGSKEEAFVLRGDFKVKDKNHCVALKKSSTDSYVAKVDGDQIGTIGELASLCPTQVIEPSSFNILAAGAVQRRKFFDWGVFHVEHGFLGHWKRYINCLKQRNSLLRCDTLDRNQIRVWDESLGSYGEALHAFRDDYFNHFIATFNRIKLRLLADDVSARLDVSYYPGWDTSKGSLASILNDHLGKDAARKQTHYGAHRSDLKITFKGLPVTEGLSRGQQKLLVVCLFLSNIEALRSVNGKTSVLLFDDIGAELDEGNALKVVKGLLESGAQVVCTALDLSLIRSLSELSNGKDIEMFHVEHGEISQKDISL
jgi:DNA replication and repair protein RecF